MDNFSISGTGCYRAPELLEGREIVGNKSDIYSLGVSLYKLLVHKGKKRLQFDPLIFAHQVDQYKDVPDDILEVILALTKNDPQERLSPQKAATALHRALLAHDKERYAVALKTALYALRGRVPMQTNWSTVCRAAQPPPCWRQQQPCSTRTPKPRGSFSQEAIIPPVGST